MTAETLKKKKKKRRGNEAECGAAFSQVCGLEAKKQAGIHCGEKEEKNMDGGEIKRTEGWEGKWVEKK